MPYLARITHFDTSDQQIFAQPATTGEWAISGGFEFANWDESDITGKARQAFANGWMGIGSFGRGTFVAVSAISEAELETVTNLLAGHLIAAYGAPDKPAALGAAREEIAFMQELCEGHPPNTLLAVQRELGEQGIHEQYRYIAPQEADLEILAVHGSAD